MNHGSYHFQPNGCDLEHVPETLRASESLLLKMEDVFRANQDNVLERAQRAVDVHGE